MFSLIFKSIEDEAGKTSVKVTGIFSELKSAKDALFAGATTKSDFRFADNLSQYKELKAALDLDKAAIESFLQSVQSGASKEEALATSFANASSAAKEYANSMSDLEIRTTNATSAAIKFEAQQKMASVTTKAQNKSLANTRT